MRLITPWVIFENSLKIARAFILLILLLWRLLISMAPYDWEVTKARTLIIKNSRWFDLLSAIANEFIFLVK